jgi:hypothetical protein
MAGFLLKDVGRDERYLLTASYRSVNRRPWRSASHRLVQGRIPLRLPAAVDASGRTQHQGPRRRGPGRSPARVSDGV